MNILIKLMSIVSLVIAPTLSVIHHDKIEANRKAQLETLIKMSAPKEVSK
jgi:K(+)-stimulated pyrophosphate-energized sodium pump